MSIIEELIELALRNGNKITFHDLVKKVGKNRGNVYKYLKQMVSKGLVTEETVEVKKNVKFFSKSIDNK